MPQVEDASILAASTDDLLTIDELKRLTGYRQAARAQEWLHARNWVYEPGTRRGDWPKVLRSYRDQRMSGTLQTARRVGPRIEFFTRGRT